MLTKLAIDDSCAVALVNDDPEDAEALRRVLRENDLAAIAPFVREADVEPVRELRARLRLAFAASGEEEAVAVLNAILRDYGTAPQLVLGEGGWDYRFDPPAAGLVGVLAAETASALLEVIRREGWARFGICEATGCADVYVDHSRNRSRRYCSPACNDRMSQAAHRARRRSR